MSWGRLPATHSACDSAHRGSGGPQCQEGAGGVGGPLAGVGAVRGGNQAQNGPPWSRRFPKFPMLRAAFSHRKHRSGCPGQLLLALTHPDPPTLTQRPGGSRAGTWEMAFWPLSPPPPGPDAVLCLSPPQSHMSGLIFGEKRAATPTTFSVLGYLPATSGTDIFTSSTDRTARFVHARHTVLPQVQARKEGKTPDSLLFPLSRSRRARHFPPSLMASPQEAGISWPLEGP